MATSQPHSNAHERAPTPHNTATASRAAGGYFIGTVPDGRRIMAHLQAAPVLDEPLLKLQRKWEVGGRNVPCDWEAIISAEWGGELATAQVGGGRARYWVRLGS
jgi:hypothetical protein